MYVKSTSFWLWIVTVSNRTVTLNSLLFKLILNYTKRTVATSGVIVVSRKKAYIIGLISVIFLFLIWDALRIPKKMMPPPTDVTATTVESQAMPFTLEFPAKIEPLQSVQISPQVSGILKQIDFTPGQPVKAGQLLFEITPDPFVIALEQAQSALAGAEAQLASYSANEERSRSLIKGGYISQQDYETIKAQMQMQQATVQGDKEKIVNAQLQLNYTKITAPIDGKTGNVIVKMGDYITTDTSAQPLVTINKVDPVYITFNLPQSELRSVMMYKNKAPLTVEAWSEDGKQKLGEGTLAFIDNAINTSTGTILLKGLIPNQDHLLWPSQLVTMRLILYVNNDAMVIASTALKTDDQGNFVYKITGKNAFIQRVKVGWQAGQLTVISSGLNVGDVLIKMVPPSFQNGSRIKIFQHEHKHK